MASNSCQHVKAVFPPKSNRLKAILVAVVSLAVIRPTTAQIFDFKNDQPQIVELNGLWRFHTGDDLRWSYPDFDDSGWPLLRSDQPWTAQGYRGYGGVAWYRFKILVPESHKPLQLYIPAFTTNYQIFADGKLIGAFGGMPPNQRVGELGGDHIYLLSGDSENSARRISIAIRVWHWPFWATSYGGGPGLAPFVGEADLVRDKNAYFDLQTFWSDADRNILVLVYMLASLASLALFLLRRTEREYLWFGLSELFTGAELVVQDYHDFYDTWFHPFQLIAGSLRIAGVFFFILFLLTLFSTRRNWLYWTAMAALVPQILLGVPIAEGWISASTMFATAGLLLLPVYACMMMIPSLAAKRRVPDAQWLLPPVVLSCAANSFGFIIDAIISSGRTPLTRDSFNWFSNLSDWPFPFSVRDVANLLVQLSILLILLRRYARTRRDEQRMTTEFESARVVQSVLIPSGTPEIPGFSIAGVYKPATQVGGDLFQIIPNGNGGVLVAIGDVSGKGMPAAMTVSLLVGTIRTLAHYTQSPGEILSAMNDRMLTRSAGGFTTCLALRVDSDGTLTVANAGHIAPYVNGTELPLENGLPLGLDAGSTYLESTFRLALAEQLTLMTDGVVEARDRTGELYGFDRAAVIASGSAESIARAAQEFGQEDDITVVTLVRLCVAEEAADTRLPTPLLSALPET